MLEVTNDGPHRDQHLVHGNRAAARAVFAPKPAGSSRRNPRRELVACNCLGIERLMALADHHLDQPDAGMAGECLERVAQHRRARQHLILFRFFAAGPQSGPPGDDDHGRRHATPLRLFRI